jgi:nicotinamide mononucleotide transporter
MNLLLILEIVSVIFNVIFLILLTKEIKQCWIYGIIGSLVGAYVIYKNGYYSESILYVFYAVVGIYGYKYWDSQSQEDFKIKRSGFLQVILLILGGAASAFGLGYLMSKTDASKPYLDALSTAFSIMATFLELYKYFVAWGFWIVINAYTIWLYELKELNFLALQMIIYTGLSIYGLITWHKKISLQK